MDPIRVCRLLKHLVWVDWDVAERVKDVQAGSGAAAVVVVPPGSALAAMVFVPASARRAAAGRGGTAKSRQRASAAATYRAVCRFRNGTKSLIWAFDDA